MFYEGNKVLTMLEQKKIPLGIQCFTGNTELVEVMGATGFDFVMFDCVHSGNDVRAMEELVRTATLAGMASYIRVPDAHNETDVRRAVEAGAEGLVLREVHSVDDIKPAANAASFLPKGDRRILPPTVGAAGQASRAGGPVFALGRASMGFRSGGEDTVRALADGVGGVAEWPRPPVPESGFTDDRPVQSEAVPKATHAR